LLRDRLIEMQVVEYIGLETIRTTLKKTRSKPWLKKDVVYPNRLKMLVLFCQMEDVSGSLRATL